ncbi:hypothetical protein NDU88_003855 [Pleurodeles waltl]|uniref:Uncharacterized protein n=1 Tax=Pleurodeles waltl TaxID=8319 RepID=A0AAV7NQX9_PLEWA|nr:hypothetical protein NDU88_003855 [Pleurodeles waltl]
MPDPRFGPQKQEMDQPKRDGNRSLERFGDGVSGERSSDFEGTRLRLEKQHSRTNGEEEASQRVTEDELGNPKPELRYTELDEPETDSIC